MWYGKCYLFYNKIGMKTDYSYSAMIDCSEIKGIIYYTVMWLMETKWDYSVWVNVWAMS